MPWNEPGGDNKDPWKRPRDQGPPDLDELLRKLKGRFGGLFGRGSGGGQGGGEGGGSALILYAVIAVLLIGWLISGFYIVNAGERGLVLRFGAYVATSEPGPHWHLPYPIETVEVVDVDQVRSTEHRATMLTQDENIVDIEIAVQYRVKDAADYTFKVLQPENALRQATQSAVREVVGKSTMDFVLGEGRGEVAQRTRSLTQTILDDYQAGLEVLSVNMQQAQPPDEVQAAFEDAIKAREDEIRFINEAEAYANGVIPLARGDAARIVEEANAYLERVVERAEGDAARFSQLLVEYEEAPAITRERLYLETMESVFSKSSKVLLDAEGTNNLLYLPVDRMMDLGARSSKAPEREEEDEQAQEQSDNEGIVREPRMSRSRESR